MAAQSELIMRLAYVNHANPRFYDNLSLVHNFLTLVPQKEAGGPLTYLFGCGISVEMLTKKQRKHEDLDIVALDERLNTRFGIIQMDVVVPSRFWCEITLDNRFLRETAYPTLLPFSEKKGSFQIAWIIHPAISLVQKCSDNKIDGVYKAPRNKDTADALSLMNYWKYSTGESQSWIHIINHTIDMIPHEIQRSTKERVSKLIPSLHLSL